MSKREKSWRVDYVSPIRAYFDNNKELEVSHLLMENSADSFRTSLEFYTANLPFNSNYKHVILLLDHSMETLLKARLSLDAKDSILQRRHILKLDKTLNIHKCIYELQKNGIILSNNYLTAICDLHDVRNDIWHFGFLGKKDPLDKLISFCSCVYWVFLMTHMPKYGIRSMLNSQQFETLMSFEDRWHFAKYHAVQLMCAWHESLNIEQSRYYARYCKECLTLSTIIDTYSGTARCRCCGQDYKASDFPME